VEEDFRWLGLDWDLGGSEGGDCYFQSNRREIYEEYLHRLDQKGLLYPCYCSRGQLHAAQAPHASDGTAIYSGTCRNLTAEQRAEREKTRRPALRVRVPDETIGFHDGRMGDYEENLAQDCGDFILRRSDGVHGYQLAVVVDDGLMGITQVVRGRDLLTSTPRQIWLQRQFGFPQPDYFHTPLLNAPDGRRLSKRDADLDLGAIRAAGIKPEEVVGFLAFRLGLLDRQEAVPPRELISSFSWSKVTRDDLIIDTN
jgi:glutamyl-tRNA synthetase